MSKKCLYVVNVDDYFPELTLYTLPNLQKYADRIGSDFKIIDQRKFPEFPPTYEKMQIFDLGQNYEWNILVDADMLFSDKMNDPTEVISPDHVGYLMGFDASLYFNPDQYFVRDGRRLGVVSNFVCTHIMCHDAWTPLEYSWEVAQPKLVHKKEFKVSMIDEFCLSRNVARFGLKCSGIIDGDISESVKHFDLNTSGLDKNKIVEEARILSDLWG